MNRIKKRVVRFSYRNRIFVYFLLVFSVFTFILTAVQNNRERIYKENIFNTNLNSYTDLVYKYIHVHSEERQNYDSIHELLKLFPSDLRLTIITINGDVIYDNNINDLSKVENHLYRPEVLMAKQSRTGSDVRLSASTGIMYYYFAQYFPAELYIRVAMPYNNSIKSELKADEFFVYIVIVLSLLAIMTLLYLSDRFGAAIRGLNSFLKSAENNNPDYEQIKFPDSELGEIGNRIVSGYKRLEDSQKQLKIESEKIRYHFQYAKEGVAIFASDNAKIYSNTLFIQYINIISDRYVSDISQIFAIPEFAGMEDFMKMNQSVDISHEHLPMWQKTIFTNGYNFSISLVIFHDRTYELVLSDISAIEKTKKLKYEMTNNIAHELKTPIASIRAYLETILTNAEIDKAKAGFFIQRAYKQALRLSEITNDIALITKMEEAPELFHIENINIRDIVNELCIDFELSFKEKSISVKLNIDENIVIKGNNTLIYSIFRNLITNTINYAGDDIEIVIDNYSEDDEYYYFSYYDTGKGVAEEHLNRLFDRFYRVDKGRTRKNGGSGLGLSIVKNAVILHNGQISAKNKKDAGLEFIFFLAKEFE